MRFLRRALSGLFLLSLTVGLLALAAGSVRDALSDRAAEERPDRAAAERVFAAAVTTIETGTVTPVLTAFGEVRARRTLEVRATRGGRVVELGPGVEEGASVTQGQLLFRVDPAAAETALSVARADLRDAERELTDAEAGAELATDDLAAAREQSDLRERALSRQSDLRRRGVGTEAAVETAEVAAASARQQVLSRRSAEAQARARVSQAETALERARIALTEAERDLEDTRVTAAFSGALSDVAVVAGGLVSQNERLADLLDPEALEVAFRVSTTEYANLARGSDLMTGEVTVRLDTGSTGIASPARITRVSAAVGEGQIGRLLFARLEDATGFRPGDFVRVEISEPPLQDAARLPAAAVDARGGVLLVGEDDRLESATVEVLRRQGDDVIVRASGLSGREVVAERSRNLGPGIRIRPLREGDEAAPPEDLLELSEERRAALIAKVEENARMPDAAKARVLAQLREPRVPAQVVARIEGRDG